MEKTLKLKESELEEILTVAEQCKVMMPKLSYNEQLIEDVFYCMKYKKPLTRDMVKRAHNNFIAQCFIGLFQTDLTSFKKLDEYMENDY